jgi:hypothetical protein
MVAELWMLGFPVISKRFDALKFCAAAATTRAVFWHFNVEVVCSQAELYEWRGAYL